MKIPTLKEGDAVLVIWQDAFEDEEVGWHEVSAFPFEKKLLGARVKQAGIFLRITQDMMYLAEAYIARDAQVAGVSAIPVGCILRIKKIT